MVFGTSFFGKVCVVPGVLYVATSFIHVAFIPFVPTGSWIVTGSGTKRFLSGVTQGHELRSLYWPSVIAAWLRSFVIAALAISVLCLVVVVMMEGKLTHQIIAAGITAACLTALWATFTKLARASAQRVSDVCSLADAPPELVAAALAKLPA
jgi:hypothetical protein